MSNSFFDPDENNKRSCDNRQNLEYLWGKFETAFPTEEACLTEIECRVCRSRDLELNSSKRIGKCTACKNITWLTAGTFLDHMKMPKPRLAAIWLTSKGLVLNSLAFSKLVNIAQSSAHSLLRWVRFSVLNILPPGAPLAHTSLFTSVFRKRSLETPAREHPVAEQVEIERMTSSCEASGKATRTPDNSNDAADLPSDTFSRQDPFPESSSKTSTDCNKDSLDPDDIWGRQELVLKLLSDAPLHFEKLLALTHMPVGKLSATLMMLQLAGKAERRDGDMYVRKAQATRITGLDQKLSPVINAFLNFIQTNFRGISRKYLQLYLAAYWCHTDRAKWSDEPLWKACLGSMPVSYRQLRNYVSPVWVTLPPQFS